MSEPAPPSAPPRNKLGTVTFAVVILGAILAVFPATAALAFLVFVLAIVPAILAHRRTRKGIATNGRASLAALVMAPLFLLVAMVVVAANASPPAGAYSGGARALSDSATLAAPTSAPTTTAAAPASTIGTPATPSQASAPALSASSARVQPLVASPAPVRATPAAAVLAKPAAPTSAAPTSVAPKSVTKAVAPKTAASKTAATKTAPTSAAAPPSSSSCDKATHYVNSDGHCVLRPVASAGAPSGASARCKDGTYSFSQHRQGTCSGHRGVSEWL